MPKINLKPNSPEFDSKQSKAPRTSGCDMPGCMQSAEYKAPKHRGLNEYYMFCLDHVREYNKAWNYFEGLSESEVQEHMYKSIYGDRPTWKYGVNGNAEDDLYDKIYRAYHGEDAPPRREEDKERKAKFSTPQQGAEYEALAIMGLEPPIDLKKVKARYKELAKKYHPDLNKGCAISAEKFKQVNVAYTILKLAYEAYEKLPERS